MPTVAYRATRSRRKFMHSRKVRRMLADALDAEVKPHLVGEFDKVVADWDHKPEFKARKFIRGDRIWVNIFPAGIFKQIWKWVSGGTKGPYKIPKGGPGYLAFRTGYVPRTRPVGKFGGPGKATGAWRRGVMQVTHPGIEARKFEETIAKEQKKWFSRTMNNAWRRIIRRI